MITNKEMIKIRNLVIQKDDAQSNFSRIRSISTAFHTFNHSLTNIMCKSDVKCAPFCWRIQAHHNKCEKNATPIWIFGQKTRKHITRPSPSLYHISSPWQFRPSGDRNSFTNSIIWPSKSYSRKTIDDAICAAVFSARFRALSLHFVRIYTKHLARCVRCSSRPTHHPVGHPISIN